MAITTVSNENKTRVDYLVYKQVTEVLALVKQANETLNDTGDIDSDSLDNASSHLKCAVDMLDHYLRANA
jgi:hypothetical protein